MTLSMPFGKFRGRPLTELPDDYLAWLLTIDLRDRLREAVEAEAERREGDGPAAGRSREAEAALRATPGCGDAASRIVNAGYRAMALAAHPDQGGGHDAMAELNAAVAILRRYLQEELL
jgi:hypothetical protein